MTRKAIRRSLIVSGSTLLLFVAASSTTRAQDASAEPTPEERVRAAYTKHEYQIPMRDGAQLFTAVYAPQDTSRTYPILMFRTPYSVRPYGEDEYRESLGPSELFQDAGYIFVYQDVRGCFRSDGKFINMTPHAPAEPNPNHVNESTDTYDTIEWLLENVERNNGRACHWRIAWMG